MNRWSAMSAIWLLGAVVDPSPAGAFATVRRNHDLDIWVGIPPATFLVVDADGRRAGADPTITLSPEGLPPYEVLPGTPPIHRNLGVLQEIPNTDVEVTNISDDNPPHKMKPATAWAVRIVDGGSQTYRVQLRGLVAGVSRVGIAPGREGGRDAILPTRYHSVLVSPGVLRELVVTFDPPRSFVPVVTRVVAAGGLVEDLKTACSLNMIAPGGVCRSLEAKALAAAESLKNGKQKAARGQIRAFLRELKAQAGKNVHEPALTILREEATALLNPSQAQTKGAPQGNRKHTPKPVR